MMTEEVPEDIRQALETHPCYTEKAHHKFARIHLPVAPRCNIQCNYCNRKYDCVNESRPGVTSEVLTPEEAVEKVRMVKEKMSYLKVAAIAGPGDPLANEESFRTMELIKENFPDLTLCLSTNGLNLPQYVDKLRDLDIRFLTVTINSVDPEVGKDIYDFVIWEGRMLRGREAAERLMINQLEGIRRAVELGILVKANVVMIPSINASHIPEITRKMKELGVYIVNILPLIPVPGTKFEKQRPPTARERKELQDQCESNIKMMRHCKMCRADAIGLLGHDRSAEFANITCTPTCGPPPEEGPVGIIMEGRTSYKVAVASSDGKTVDIGFGQATGFLTFKVEGKVIEEMGRIDPGVDIDAPLFGPAHAEKLSKAAKALAGHDLVIASEFGHKAVDMLQREGIAPVAEKGSIREAIRKGVDALYEQRERTFE
jgi:nitrogen fixation protein NifB